MASEYDKELRVFSNNVQLAAKTFYYYYCFNEVTNNNHMLLLKLQNNASFWNLFRHTSCVTIFIYLGKIFDKPKKAHKVDDLLRALKKETIVQENELCVLKEKVSVAKDRWEEMKSVRHAVIAHDERQKNLKSVSEMPDKIPYEDIKSIIDDLLWGLNFLINKGLSDDEFDFTSSSQAISKRAEMEIEKLLNHIYDR